MASWEKPFWKCSEVTGILLVHNEPFPKALNKRAGQPENLSPRQVDPIYPLGSCSVLLRSSPLGVHLKRHFQMQEEGEHLLLVCQVPDCPLGLLQGDNHHHTEDPAEKPKGALK